jgi:hypothetical protein
MTAVQAHLGSRLFCLLISPCFLFWADNFASFSITHDGRRAFALRLIGLLESSLHVSGKRQVPYEWQESFPAKDCAKDLFRVDKAALRRALLGPEFIILVP